MSEEYYAYCACDNGYTGYTCDTSELCVQDTFFEDEAVLVVDGGPCGVWEGCVCAYICIFDVLQDLKCVEMSFARTMGHV